MITSNDNERLKLVRKLRDRKWREREGMFATEGEDLLERRDRRRLEAGRRARRSRQRHRRRRGRAGSARRRLDARLGYPRDRGLADPGRADRRPSPAVYLHGVGDPGNVGTIVRTAAALAGARVVLGAGSADPYSPKAVRASMGALFATPPARGRVEETPGPRLALVAHGGADLDEAIAGLSGSATLCLGAEREGLPAVVARGLRRDARRSRCRAGRNRSTSPRRRRSALQRISSIGSRRAG